MVIDKEDLILLRNQFYEIITISLRNVSILSDIIEPKTIYKDEEHNVIDFCAVLAERKKTIGRLKK